MKHMLYIIFSSTVHTKIKCKIIILNLFSKLSSMCFQEICILQILRILTNKLNKYIATTNHI